MRSWSKWKIFSRKLDQARTALADPQRVLIIGDRPALGGRQNWRVALRNLMQLAAVASHQHLVVDPRFLPVWFLGQLSCPPTRSFRSTRAFVDVQSSAGDPRELHPICRTR